MEDAQVGLPTEGTHNRPSVCSLKNQTQGGLEVVPAGSHKPNYVRSTRTPATSY